MVTFWWGSFNLNLSCIGLSLQWSLFEIKVRLYLTVRVCVWFSNRFSQALMFWCAGPTAVEKAPCSVSWERWVARVHHAQTHLASLNKCSCPTNNIRAHIPSTFQLRQQARQQTQWAIQNTEIPHSPYCSQAYYHALQNDLKLKLVLGVDVIFPPDSCVHRIALIL